MPASYVLEAMVPVLQDHRGHCDAVTTTAPPRTPGNKLSVEVHADSTLSTTMLMDRSYKELKMQTAEHHWGKGGMHYGHFGKQHVELERKQETLR